jgi:hypothetical protein
MRSTVASTAPSFFFHFFHLFHAGRRCENILLTATWRHGVQPPSPSASKGVVLVFDAGAIERNVVDHRATSQSVSEPKNGPARKIRLAVTGRSKRTTRGYGGDGVWVTVRRRGFYMKNKHGLSGVAVSAFLVQARAALGEEGGRMGWKGPESGLHRGRGGENPEGEKSCEREAVELQVDFLARVAVRFQVLAVTVTPSRAGQTRCCTER